MWPDIDGQRERWLPRLVRGGNCVQIIRVSRVLREVLPEQAAGAAVAALPLLAGLKNEHWDGFGSVQELSMTCSVQMVLPVLLKRVPQRWVS